MMEEVLHSIQVSHLQKGWNTPQGKSIREKYQKALTLGITNPYLQNTGNELVDVAEFIAGIYASPELRQDLEKADKGFIDRFLYSLKRLLQELIPGKGFETIHHNMIEMVKQNFGKVNFLESQQVAQEVKEVKKELSPSEKLNEIRKDEVQVIPQKPIIKNNITLTKKNLFTVKPIQAVDKKAIVKASVATQYIGFGEGIANSSTELYRQQVLEQEKSNIDFQVENSGSTMREMYLNRTAKNASADATLDFGLNQEGESWTKSAVIKNNKKYIGINTNNLVVTDEVVDKVIEQLNSVNAKSLNIAGMGIYNMKTVTQEQVDNYVYQLLNAVINSPKLKTKIESIRSGGQTGFDEAGAKAGQRLGIKTLILAPKGFTFRNKVGKDISNEQQFKERFKTKLANTGNYSSNDVIFVSIGGKRGDAIIRKEQQDKTIREALKAIEAGATLITDNKSYVENSDYNEGEKRLAKNLEAKGYNYSEQTIDGQVLGVWSKKTNSTQQDFESSNNLSNFAEEAFECK